MRPITLALLVLFFVQRASAQSAPLLTVEANGATMHSIDFTTGRTRSTRMLSTVNGRALPGVTAMAWDAVRGNLLVATAPFATGTRYLATVDPNANAVLGPTLVEEYEAFAFDDQGNLWAVTSDTSSTPECLFRVDPVHGTETFVLYLAVGSAGETLTFQPADGLLYHASGRGAQNSTANGEIFETIDPLTGTRNTKTLRGADYDGAQTLLPLMDDLFLVADTQGSTFLVDRTGLISSLEPLDHVPRAMAFAPDATMRAFARTYGFGCPGTAGYAAALFAPDAPARGSQVTLRGFQATATPTAPGVLVFGLGNGSLPLTPGCPLQVLPVVQAFFPVSWSGLGPGDARVTFAFGIPAVLHPGDVFAQIVWLDGNALLVTNPVQMHVE
ncbi:MAG: hypothetical protein H6834_06580 [Planctomycetes bacterium]|nr:hypothetical protein [Planctomycetota bacterium]MCB9891817.1 hypothetical protein [Planctomycetota bacterium]